MAKSVTSADQLVLKDELKKYEIKHIKGLSGSSKGSGSYGAVYEVTVKGIARIAKRLHNILVSPDVSQAERQGIRDKFLEECLMLSQLDHQNIVKFVGVHFNPKDRSDITLIMERLHTDLDKFLSPDVSPNEIPLLMKLSILADVSSGLLYLHTGLDKPLIHRDLTAGNVLLTEDLKQAKIADLGVSKLVDNYAHRTATRTVCPGTLAYMPPEALVEKPKYDTSLDIFSFGHLSLYVALQKFPVVYEISPEDMLMAYQSRQVAVFKRKKWIDRLGSHRLRDTICTCLNDDPQNRPTTKDVNESVKALHLKLVQREKLMKYEVKHVEGLSGASKGSGSYGAVYEVTVKGVARIAKRLHNILVSPDVSQAERQGIRDKFIEECLMLSQLDHQNIVKFVGVHFNPKDRSDITLIMEQLHTDLDKFLSPDVSPHEIPLLMKLSILADVSSGLLYLHTGLDKPLIHRDLTAGNVLLTEDFKRAKIADLGVSKLVDNYAHRTTTRTVCPGTLAYMPPEALVEKPKYDTSLDIFSFGHLSLYVALQKFPVVYEISPEDMLMAYQSRQVAVFKRKKWIDKLDSHCLRDTICTCLNDEPKNRPSTKDVNGKIMDLLLLERNKVVSIPVASPPAMVAATSCQEFQSDHQTEVGEEFPIPKSSSLSGLIPRAPMGSEWSRSKPRTIGEESDVVPLHEVLKDLNLKAGDALQRERLYSIQTEQIVNKPVSWEEDVPANSHFWTLVDTREACHLTETQFCQRQKLQYPKGRAKVRCSACRILAHTSCIKQLYYEGYTCKDTFREIKQKVKETHMCHHFLHRRKLPGKCTKCDRGFGNWKKVTGKDIVGYSCSWCGDSYHVPCFNGHQLRKEPCHLGPLRNLIIPPSWIVRTPPIKQDTPSVQLSNDSSNSFRRKTRRSRRRKRDDRASKYFTVKPLPHRQNKPLLVFLNPKSGGNQGAKLMQTFQYLLNPRQVFDLSQGGPKFGLKIYQMLSNFRILACGGDGTVSWILSVLDELDIRPAPPIAILPLGMTNDLSRVLKWGPSYSDEPLDKILMHVEEGPVVKLDRWQVNVWENPQVWRYEIDFEGVPDVPLHVINNYFSIGLDAEIALLFHNEREANPEKINTQFKNKFFSFKAVSKDLLSRKFQSMTDHMSVWCDGDDYTAQIRSLRLEAICFLNIPSYSAGTNPWGTPSSKDRFQPQSMDDGVIEVIGFWSSTFGKLQMGIARGERIAQCRHLKILTDASLPVQIDGEACKLQPSTIEVGIKNTIPMIRKAARRSVETPLHGTRPTDRIKLSLSKVTSDQYEQLNSNLHEIRKIAKPLGLVVATSEDTLKTIRPQIDRYTEDDDDDGKKRLAKDWRFLDVATTGRVDRMFKVLPDQEDSVSIGDILTDSLLVVELDTCRRLPSSTEVPINPQIIWPPDDEIDPIPAPLLPEIALSPDEIDSQDTDIDVSITTQIQKSFLDAVKRGQLDKVKIFHQQGAVLTALDSNTWTPLHHAARLGRTEVVQYLADNIPTSALDLVEDEKLQTALHKAAWFGYTDICKILIDKGASPTRTDYQYNTPYDKAIQSGDKELQQYLKELQGSEDSYEDELPI